MDLINEVMATIADPAAVPEVSHHANASLKRVWPFLDERNQSASVPKVTSKKLHLKPQKKEEEAEVVKGEEKGQSSLNNSIKQRQHLNLVYFRTCSDC